MGIKVPRPHKHCFVLEIKTVFEFRSLKPRSERAYWLGGICLLKNTAKWVLRAPKGYALKIYGYLLLA